jgi:hypothetical protein
LYTAGQPTYDAQYTGRACRYDSAAGGHTFFAHTYADSDGGDCTPFLPTSLFSTAFATPVAWEFLVFASDQPGTSEKDANFSLL